MAALEAKATTSLGLELDAVSAKVRSSPPGDDEMDYHLPLWAFVVQFSMQWVQLCHVRGRVRAL